MGHSDDRGRRARVCGRVAPPRRHVDHGGDGLHGRRPARRCEGLRARRAERERRDGQAAGRVDACGRALRRRGPDRPARALEGEAGSGPPARDRAAADHRRRLRRRPARARLAGLAGGAAARRRPCADGRCARSGGGHAAEPALAHPAGAQRRERAQRRDLRPDLHGRAGGCLDRGGPDHRVARRPAAGRADRLRRAPRHRRRRGRRGGRRPRRAARARRPRLAADRARRGGGARVHGGGRGRRVGLHRRLRRGHGLRRDQAPGRRRGRVPDRAARRHPRGGDLHRLRRCPARAQPRRRQLGRGGVRAAQPDGRPHASGRDRA